MTQYYLERPDNTRIAATEEQTAIIDFARTDPRSILISTPAGSAKTTTLEFLAKYLPGEPILCLAFNKRIADELTKRLPSHCTPKTMNALGHRVWGTTVPHRLVLNNDKVYAITKSLIEDLRGADRSEAYDYMSDIIRAVKFAKRAGYAPPNAPSTAKSIWTQEDFYATLDEDHGSLITNLIDSILLASIKQSYHGTIDFDDQLYMPVVFGGSFPKFPRILVDETQDLSPINHLMLRKLFTKWMAAVGDPCQSIYAFRGAKIGGMESLGRDFKMVPFRLSISFRCPQAIVELARRRVPYMKWIKPGGHVETLSSLFIEDIPDGSAFICRNNAPLFRLALQLLSCGRGCNLVGTDLGPALVRTLKKLGPETLTQQETVDAIAQWEMEKLAKARNPEAVSDKAECLRVFARFAETLGGAIAYADHLFKARGAIQLLSGHKAKGLEWDTVFHLDPWRIPSIYAEDETAKEQEANLEYVITTRAKQTLYLIDLENIQWESERAA